MSLPSAHAAASSAALPFSLCRNLHLAYNRVRSGDYSLSGLEGWEVKSKTIGVLGTGAIGCAAVSMFKVTGLYACLVPAALQPKCSRGK